MPFRELTGSDLLRPLGEVINSPAPAERPQISSGEQAAHEAALAVATILRIGGSEIAQDKKLAELMWIKNNVDRAINEVEG
jgi:hypothetical protein